MTLPQKYNSERLTTLHQIELQNLLNEFKQEQLPIWKYAAFFGYNALSFSLMFLYGFNTKKKFTKPGFKKSLNPSDYSLINIVKKGTKHGLLISSLYLSGMYLLTTSICPFEIFYKLTEIQSKIYSFTIRYDAFYQQSMLFAKMRKFGISESLISQIQKELQSKKLQLQNSNGLKKETLEHLKKSQILFQANQQRMKGFQELI